MVSKYECPTRSLKKIFRGPIPWYVDLVFGGRAWDSFPIIQLIMMPVDSTLEVKAGKLFINHQHSLHSGLTATLRLVPLFSWVVTTWLSCGRLHLHRMWLILFSFSSPWIFWLILALLTSFLKLFLLLGLVFSLVILLLPDKHHPTKSQSFPSLWLNWPDSPAHQTCLPLGLWTI